MKEHYRVLGVSEKATEHEIKTAYKKLAVQHHPDKGGDEEKFKQINNAYNILSDPLKRNQYDHEDCFGFMNAANAAGRGGGGATFHPFASFFGGGFNPFFHQDANHSQRPHSNAKIVHKLDTTLEHAYQGINKKIAITMMDKCPRCRQMCLKCQGSGMNVENHIQISNNRQFVKTVRVPCASCLGQGFTKQEAECEQCSSSGQIEETHTVIIDIPARTFQDFTKTFHIKTHIIEVKVHIVFPPNFERHGNDLVYRHKIKLVDALLGSEINVAHPSGEVIEINNSTRKHTIHPGTVLTFHNKGVIPNTHLKVHFDIQFPALKPTADAQRATETYIKIKDVFEQYFDDTTN